MYVDDLHKCKDSFQKCKVFIHIKMLTTMKTTPGQRLKQFREKAGLRQEAIAAELDVSLSIIQKVEVSQKELSDKMAEALCRRYAIPLEWLIKGQGELTYQLEKENPYRDTLYKELREQIDFLKEIIKGNFPLPGNDNSASIVPLNRVRLKVA